MYKIGLDFEWPLTEAVLKYLLKFFYFALLCFVFGVVGCTASDPEISTVIYESSVSEDVEAQKSVLTAPAFMSDASRANYNLRVQEIERQPDLSGGIIFIGDDLTEQALWGALFPEVNIRNHGIAGDTTAGVEKRLSLLTRHSPEQIYLMIGEHDGPYGRTSQEVSDSVSRIILLLHAGHPTSQIYLQSPIPSNQQALAWNTDLTAAFEHMVTRPEIKATGAEFIDLLPAYMSGAGTLRDDLYNDNSQFGSHGYAVWASVLSRNVMKTIR